MFYRPAGLKVHVVTSIFVKSVITLTKLSFIPSIYIALVQNSLKAGFTLSVLFPQMERLQRRGGDVLLISIKLLNPEQYIREILCIDQFYRLSSMIYD